MKNNWLIFWNNIKKSLKTPIKNPYFRLYFICFVVLIWWFWIWILFFKKFMATYKWWMINLAVISFSIVLLITSWTDIILKENSKNNWLSIIWLLSIIIIPAIIMVVTFCAGKYVMFFSACIFYVLSLFSWWIANWDKDLFNKDIVDVDQMEKQFDVKLQRRKR